MAAPPEKKKHVVEIVLGLQVEQQRREAVLLENCRRSKCCLQAVPW